MLKYSQVDSEAHPNFLMSFGQILGNRLSKNVILINIDGEQRVSLFAINMKSIYFYTRPKFYSEKFGHTRTQFFLVFFSERWQERIWKDYFKDRNMKVDDVIFWDGEGVVSLKQTPTRPQWKRESRRKWEGKEEGRVVKRRKEKRMFFCRRVIYYEFPNEKDLDGRYTLEHLVYRVRLFSSFPLLKYRLKAFHFRSVPNLFLLLVRVKCSKSPFVYSVTVETWLPRLLLFNNLSIQF